MTLQYHDFGIDSVDAVFDANKPQKLETGTGNESRNLVSRETNTCSPFRRSAIVRFCESKDDKNCVNNIRNVESRCQSENGKELHDDKRKLNDIEHLCSEDFLKININLDDLINKGRELSEESRSNSVVSPIQKKRKKKSKHPKKKKPEEGFQLSFSHFHSKLVSPDIHRNVYIRALQDARAKYFRRTYPGLTTTEAYKFSYFDVCSKIEEHKERYRREKDFRNYVGMKRIFGDIRMDDYYSVCRFDRKELLW